MNIENQSENQNFFAWIGLFAFCLVVIAFSQTAEWLVAYPERWALPLQTWTDISVNFIIDLLKPAFRAFAAIFTLPMQWIQSLLQWMPWPVTVGLFILIAYKSAGRQVAIFTGATLLYILVVGHWEPSMNTLALVLLAIPFAAMLGFVIGVLGFRSPRANAIIQPTLDFMQTIPTFAYLIPILLLFGFGPIVGLIASIIFAVPPMVRNVILGLQRVPTEILESGSMNGCTPRQRFWQVEVPTALPQIMIGVNQTTMAAFSMIIIAAIIGGFEDIGWEVLSTMRKAQFGQSMIAGLVIAFLAMVLDRITYGFAQTNHADSQTANVSWRRVGIYALGIIVIGSALAQVIPALGQYPKAWVLNFARPLNQGVIYITANYIELTTTIKNTFLAYFMIPIRSGLSQAIIPALWGVEFTPEARNIYIGVVALLSLLVGFTYSRWVGLILAFFGGFMLFGTTTLPWLCIIGIVTLLGWQCGGRNVGLFVLGAQLLMLVSNLWLPAMRSVYLSGAAVILCIVMGGAIGVWAAENNRVSTFIRPINDTFQTMPQFVLLIPALMFFKIGEFTALLAIIIYAIVPMIRYTEQGLRTVSETIVEAGEAMGCTRWQMLWQVKVPQAMPVILLGVNQTIMYALSMLVIAALVGTTGLGQEIYIALSNANAGEGIVAGLSMAFIAMIADRIVMGWANQRRAALGL
ncbi:MAG: ABC transporter permease subunit [Chloroflexota bacterium]